MTDINVNQPFNDLRAAIKAAGGPSVRSRAEAEMWLHERANQAMIEKHFAEVVPEITATDIAEVEKWVAVADRADGTPTKRHFGRSILAGLGRTIINVFGGAGLSDARRPGSAASQGRTERWITRDKRPDNRPAILKNGFPIVSDAMHGHDTGWNNSPRPANSYRGARRNAARVLRRKTLKHIAARRAALTA